MAEESPTPLRESNSLEDYVPFGVNYLYDELKKNRSEEFVEKAKGSRMALRVYYLQNKVFIDMGGVLIPNIAAEQRFSNGEYVPIVSAELGNIDPELPDIKKLETMVWFACKEEEGFRYYRNPDNPDEIKDISQKIDLLVGNDEVTYVLQAAKYPRTYNVPGNEVCASTIPKITTGNIPQICERKGPIRIELPKKE